MSWSWTRIAEQLYQGCRRFRSWFGTDVGEVCCVSRVGHRSVSLMRNCAAGASLLEFRVVIRRPFAAWAGRHRLELCLRNAAGEILTGAKQCSNKRSGRTEELKLHRHGRQIRPGEFLDLEVTDRQSRVLLRKVRFECLAPAEIERRTRSLVQENIEIDVRRLWAQCAGHRYAVEWIADTTDFLMPELVLRSHGYNDFLPRLETNLVLRLESDGTRLAETSVPVVLQEGLVWVRQAALSVRDVVGGRAGLCWLTTWVDEVQVGAFPFRFVGEEQLLRELRVSQVEVDAETLEGRWRKNVCLLRPDRHFALQPRLRIETAKIAPNTEATCRIAILGTEGPPVVQEHRVKLDQPVQEFKLSRCELRLLGFREHTDSRRLHISVFIGGALKASLEVPVLPTGRIADHEGRLNISTEELVVPEAEYQEILNQLGPSPE